MPQAVINWTLASNANVASQSVEYRVRNTNDWTSAVTGLAANVSTYTVTGLSNATTYEFRVKSICSSGSTTYSAIMNGTTPN
jgi:hypothetical protein